MLIFELFSPNGDVMNRMRQYALEVITPYLAQDVPFITVNQVIDGMRSNSRTGLAIDRSLVMELLDPETVKAVSKIEGDRIFLNQPEDATREVAADDQEKDADHVQDAAKEQAKKQIQK